MDLPWDNLYINMKEANKDNLINFNIIDDDIEISPEILSATNKNNLKLKREYIQLTSTSPYVPSYILNKQFKFK
jgi:hypothetical protein